MPDKRPLSTSGEEHHQLLNALRESELLRELSELLASSLDPTRILQVLVKRTTEVCEVERCAVWLLDEAQGVFLPSAYHFATPQLRGKKLQIADYIWHRSRLPYNDPVVHQLFHQEHKHLSIIDLRKASSQFMRTIAEKFFVHSVLLVALIREDRPVGVMSLDNPGKTVTFSPEQQQLAQAIGHQAAIAIHNARLYQEAQTERMRAERLIQRAQSIYKVAAAVNSGEALATILDIASEQLVQGMGAESTVIALLHADHLIVTGTGGSIARASDFPLSPALSLLPTCEQAAIEGSPRFIRTHQAEAEERAWFQLLGSSACMIVPLVGEKQQSGQQKDTTTHCLGIAFINYPREARTPTSGYYAFALDIAAQCALAIEKARILAEAHQAATLATERANTLKATFDAMSEGILVLDMDGFGIMHNSMARRLLTLPHKKPIQAAEITRLQRAYTLQGQPIPAEDFPLLRALRGEHIRGERYISRQMDDIDRIIEVNVAPVYADTATQMGIVCAFRDVTEQVYAERRVRRALDTILHAAEAISGQTDIEELLHSLLARTLIALNCNRGMVLRYNEDQQDFVPFIAIGFEDERGLSWLEEQASWLYPEGDQYAGFRQRILAGNVTLISGDQCPEHPNPYYETMILAAPIKHNSTLQGLILLDRSLLLQKEQEGQSGSTRPLSNPLFSSWDLTVVEGIAQFAGLIVEQARLQQEAETARLNEAIMRQANELKDEFLSITAHEFRTPLTIIVAHVQMMARNLNKHPDLNNTLSAKLHDSISIVDDQAHQLTNIVNTFLEVTRLNKGQIIIKEEEINLPDIIHRAVEDHATTSPIHQLHFNMKEGEYRVKGDSARLSQIFANLLQNAIKYSPQGGPITVTLQKRLHNGKLVAEVHVEDKGVGIPVEAQSRLFERFYRAPNISHSQSRGVGLGLYLVAQFLHLHGGTIRVESSGIPGEGSCFIITLPLLEGTS
ncbi:GAF domain-containing protein [Thermosporothrix hazakensis]|jgi:signal transduction histidine kinase/PAS domain-containing protein|uniref:histidine kinase n=1 Tax=Thermosporothrix hazakensis TaxID=644383 RepID=A0A326U951_THEHA|nr:ATP-binding protein [Thermosporothrix hazakensis]PZW30666.1 GAF domain-containing protein [Thermosporothrix hazakensis]GCE49528.1 hypothetical protein KTH_43970 [Thermosporothrix hazakensis]